jgi:hypothetical protein
VAQARAVFHQAHTPARFCDPLMLRKDDDE